MSYANPIWLEGRRKYRTRHDAHRFDPPAAPKSFAARRIEQRRAEEEQAATAAERDAFEREVVALREANGRVRIMLADLKFELALRALGRKYSQNQPRVPAGSREGGQWTSGRGGTRAQSTGVLDIAVPHGVVVSDTSPDPIRPGALYAENSTSKRYSVNLDEEEAPRGIGHTQRDHVGKSDDELLEALQRRRFDTPGVSFVGKRQGSFASPEAANDFVNRTLERK
jgi:hypothetical protein